MISTTADSLIIYKYRPFYMYIETNTRYACLIENNTN